MHLFSNEIIVFVIAAKPDVPSPCPMLLFNKPIKRFPSLFLQYAFAIASASSGSPTFVPVP